MQIPAHQEGVKIGNFKRRSKVCKTVCLSVWDTKTLHPLCKEHVTFQTIMLFFWWMPKVHQWTRKKQEALFDEPTAVTCTKCSLTICCLLWLQSRLKQRSSPFYKAYWCQPPQQTLSSFAPIQTLYSHNNWTVHKAENNNKVTNLMNCNLLWHEREHLISSCVTSKCNQFRIALTVSPHLNKPDKCGRMYLWYCTMCLWTHNVSWQGWQGRK